MRWSLFVTPCHVRWWLFVCLRSSSDVPEAFRVSVRSLCLLAAAVDDDGPNRYCVTAGDLQVDNHCADTAERVLVALCIARPPRAAGGGRRRVAPPVAVSLVVCVQPACVMQLWPTETVPPLARHVASCELMVQPLVVSIEDVMLYEWAACVAGLAAAALPAPPSRERAMPAAAAVVELVPSVPARRRPLFLGRLLVSDLSITATLQATQPVYFSVNKMPVSLSSVCGARRRGGGVVASVTCASTFARPRVCVCVCVCVCVFVCVCVCVHVCLL